MSFYFSTVMLRTFDHGSDELLFPLLLCATPFCAFMGAVWLRSTGRFLISNLPPQSRQVRFWFHLSSWIMIFAPMMFVLSIFLIYVVLSVYTPVFLMWIGLYWLVRFFGDVVYFGIATIIMGVLSIPAVFANLGILSRLTRKYHLTTRSKLEIFVGDFFMPLLAFAGVPYFRRRIVEVQRQAEAGQITLIEKTPA